MVGFKFAVCRPYGARIRKRVFAFLKSIDFTLADGLVLEPGTSDETAADWIRALPPVDLFLIPFHMHRGSNGTLNDGIGVVMLLDELYKHSPRPTLMPVSRYSANASFPRRLQELRSSSKAAASYLIPMTEEQIGSTDIRTEGIEAPPSQRAPSTVELLAQACGPSRCSAMGNELASVG